MPKRDREIAWQKEDYDNATTSVRYRITETWAKSYVSIHVRDSRTRRAWRSSQWAARGEGGSCEYLLRQHTCGHARATGGWAIDKHCCGFSIAFSGAWHRRALLQSEDISYLLSPLPGCGGQHPLTRDGCMHRSDSINFLGCQRWCSVSYAVLQVLAWVAFEREIHLWMSRVSFLIRRPTSC